MTATANSSSPRLYGIGNGALLFLQFWFAVSILYQSLNKDFYIELSAHLYGENAPFMNRPILEVLLNPFFGGFVVGISLFSIFFKGRYISSRKKVLFVNTCLAILFGLLSFYIVYELRPIG